jgi:hypothetical protein
MAEIVITAADRRRYARARAEGRLIEQDPSAVVGASYDARRNTVSLEFRCGATISIPRALISEFDGASKADLRSIRGDVDVLECEPIDMHIFVPGLIEEVFGGRLLAFASGRRGGQRRSKVKAAAARRNGALGGRPRKRPSD